MKKIIQKIDNWFSERLPMASVKEFMHKQSSKPLPGHVSWFHTAGSIALFLIANQIITGILLMVYYRPTPDNAFESIKFITTKATLGWFIRGLHAWGATLMIIAVILHMMRIFFMGAFKKPRELTWVVGVALFFLTLNFGFTGYLLPWNQLSYWATTVGTEIAGSIPVIGGFVKRLLLGGDSVGGETLSRFYVVHVIVLPWILVFLTTFHIVLMRVQGLATLDRVGEEKVIDAKNGMPFFPDHVLKEMVVYCLFFGFVVTLVLLLPPELGEKADPFATPEGIKPEWYFLPTYQLIKYFPKLLGLFIATLPSLLLLFWPFIDRTVDRRFSKRPISVTIGIIGLILALVMGIVGQLSERDMTFFGKQYHIDMYGIPHTISEVKK